MPSDPPAEVLAGIQSDFANAGAALGPPLGWPGVERFEAENAVILPEPFRTFVADVGNGCAEGPPEYGLVALGTNGCGMDLVLVISGAARGEVWDISGEGAARAAPTFDAWVRDWAQAGQR